MADSAVANSHLLFAIPFSHYVEKARWAFAYYGVPYTQRKLMPVFHVFSVRSFGKRASNPRRTDGSSPFSTPCLIVYDAAGQIKASFHESHDIVVYLSEHFASPAHVNLYTSCGPENQEKILELERHYDQVFGVIARRYPYYDMLVLNKWRSIVPFATVGFANGVGLLQSLLWALLSPAIARLLAKAFCSGGITQHDKDEEACRQEFQRASELLSESAYLAGPNMSAADITFAALAYPVLGVSHDAGYSHYPPNASSPRAKAFHEELQGTRAGQHVMRLYAEKKLYEAEVKRVDKKSLLGLW